MHAHGREAAGGPAWARHRPEETQLYRLGEQHYPAFVAHLAEQGKALPAYVEQAFDAYLKCGRLEHGLHAAHPCAAPLRGSLRRGKSAILPICLRVKCESCHFDRLVADFSVSRFGPLRTGANHRDSSSM